MGLDSVELVMRIEDTFSVQISDQVATELVTPRKVADFILTQVAESQVPLPCLSQRAFHLLRNIFVQTSLISRQSFRLDTSLKEFSAGRKSRQKVGGNRVDVWCEEMADGVSPDAVEFFAAASTECQRFD